MANKALSERVKAQKQRTLNEKKLINAVKAYGLEEGRPKHLRKGARTIAQEFGIDKQWKTIINRYKGGRSLSEGHENLQKLTPAEETVLVNFLNESAERGFPQTPQEVAKWANMIRRSRLGPDCENVGESWVGRFLDRHRDILQTHWSKPLDTQRARAMNPEAKKRWFELVEAFVVKLGIKPENLYGMDETGCPPSNQGTERVVGGRGVKTQHAQGGADRENVTALITIRADGTVLRPTIIFKAKNFRSSWGRDNVSGAS
jgi:Tc5 transposase DNA-binding domain